MSVLIKGMKMPTSCIKGGCPVDALVCELWDSYDKENGWGKLKDPEKMRHPNCPLIELPDHGDLVDVDALKEECKEPYVWWETETQMARILKDAPVVIPAERSEDETN